MAHVSDRLLMYSELASWWPLMSDPADYAEEAGIFRDTIRAYSRRSVVNVLELGAGGGNNALHLKRDFRMTLTDISPAMLAVSEALNPECEHVLGDMRTLRLNRRFDGVFVHDAIGYMLTYDDLRAALRTAHEHLAAGGAALFVPDFTRETFVPSTDHGGHDGPDRAMRYLSWTLPADAGATSYRIVFAYVLKDGSGIRGIQETHQFGLFSRLDWLRALREVGFEAYAVPYEHSTFHEGPREMFCGVHP